MTILALCSGKGSPGVTTLGCLMGAVWPASKRVVITECDPSGNDLATRFGLSPRMGMTTFVLDRRGDERKPDVLDAHLQDLPGGLEVMVGPVSMDAAQTLDHAIAAIDADLFPSDIDVIADCGQLALGAVGQRRILATADHVVVVSRADAPALVHARAAISTVKRFRQLQGCLLVLIGKSPFDDREIEQVLGVELLADLPFDALGAAIASGTGGRARRFKRSSLVSRARHVVERLDIGRGDLGADDHAVTSTRGEMRWRHARLRHALPRLGQPTSVAVHGGGRAT